MAFPRRRARGSRIAAALALAWSFAAAPPAGAQNDAAGPAWLRAPHTRGPVVGTLALDDRRVWWGIDGALPLDFGFHGTRASLSGVPALGLGLSITGASDLRALRYTALLDRRGRQAGGWLGISTGRTPS